MYVHKLSMLWYGDVLVAVHDNQSAGDKIVVSHRIIKMFSLKTSCNAENTNYCIVYLVHELVHSRVFDYWL